MKNSYPIVLTPDKTGYVVYIPDFNINTEGYTLTEAIEMARDAVGLMGIDMEDDNKALPVPTPIGSVVKTTADDIVSLVDVDFAEYRRQNEIKTVRRSVTLPSWLNAAAEKSGINVSAVLQKALKKELGVNRQ